MIVRICMHVYRPTIIHYYISTINVIMYVCNKCNKFIRNNFLWHIDRYAIYGISTHCSIVLYLSISIALLTARAFQKRSRSQQLTLCWSLHAEALQATVNERLAQSRYVAAIERDSNPRSSFRSKGI